MQMNQISLDINKSGQIINEPVVLRVGEKDQTITVNLLKDGQPYTSFTTATFFANKPSGAIVANDPANISSGTITYTVPQALVNEFGKITNAYFLIDGKTSTESFVIAVLQGVKISDDLNDYIPGMDQLNVVYDKWKAKLQTITDELAGIDAPKEVKNVIDNELKNYTDQINELQKRITALKAQLDALVVPVNAVGTNLYTDTRDFENPSVWNNWGNLHKTGEKFNGLTVMAMDVDWGGLDQTIQAKKGEIYTFSVYARYKSGTGKSIIFTTSSGYSSITNPAICQVSLDETWQRIGGTFTMTDDGPLHVRLERSNDNTNELLMAGPKLEKGSVMTDWCPNPSEILTQSDYAKIKANQPDLSGFQTQAIFKTGDYKLTTCPQGTDFGEFLKSDSVPKGFSIIRDDNSSNLCNDWQILKEDSQYIYGSGIDVNGNAWHLEVKAGAYSGVNTVVSNINGKTITATDDTGKTVKLKITGIS